MEKSGFFNSVDGDRKYQATFFAEYFASFIGNGIFPNPSDGLQIIANDDMTVTVSAGQAWINGYYYCNTDDLTLTITNADGLLNRIDRVVLQYSTTDRTIIAVVREGKFASAAVVAELQRDVDYYELGLADIEINAGVISITQTNITDLRLDSTKCGVVAGTVEQVDTTTLFNQYQTWITEKKVEYNTDMTTWTATKQLEYQNWYDTTILAEQTEMDDMEVQFQDDWDVWFASIKAILDGDPIGNLLDSIDTIENDIVEIDGKVLALQNTIGDITTLDTTNKEVVGAINELFQSANNSLQQVSDGKDLVYDAIVGKRVTPPSKEFADLKVAIEDIVLGSGNAIVGNVLAGKTFTNDGGIELTGTMPNRGGTTTITPSTINQTKYAGYYSGNITIEGDADLISANIKAGKNIFGIAGNSNVVDTSAGNAANSHILSGYKAYVDGALRTGTMPNRGGATTITPSTINQTKYAGYYSGNITIAGDADLISANIKAGKNIFGVAGNSNVVDTSAGNAVASQVLSGYKCYVDGSLVTGTMANKTGGYSTDSLTKSGNELRMSIDSAGYFSDGAYLKYTDNDWIESNIKSGINMFGKVGTDVGESSIKSIQCGIGTIFSSDVTIELLADVTPNNCIVYVQNTIVNAIPNLSKLAVKVKGYDPDMSGVIADDPDYFIVERANSSYSVGYAFYWKVIEFNHVKQKQWGQINISSAPKQVTISPINPEKSILEATIYTTSDDDSTIVDFNYRIVNSTTLEFTMPINTLSTVANWQLIEFD